MRGRKQATSTTQAAALVRNGPVALKNATPYPRAMPPSPENLSIDVTRNFEGDVLGPISVDVARRRVLAYCTEPRSGWGVYDLAGIQARRAGLLDQISTWSLLLANALNGQVTLNNLADFTQGFQRDLAARIANVPADVDLDGTISDEVLERVVNVCDFGFDGVWAPKITKLAALYRPGSVPVLDGHVAQAFGFSHDSFSIKAVQRSIGRRDRIRKVVHALATGVTEHTRQLDELRELVAPAVPEIRLVPYLRLLDIVIWTSQDDRLPRRERQGKRWDERSPGEPLPLNDFEAVPLRQARTQ